MSSRSSKDQLLNSLSQYRGFVFRWQRWEQLSPDWDHDHCHGCWARFAARPEEWQGLVQTEGWVTLWPADETADKLVTELRENGYVCVPSPKPAGFQIDWICPECFETVRQDLELTINPTHPQWKLAGL